MIDITLEFMIKEMGGIITDDTLIFIRGYITGDESQLLAAGTWFEDTVLQYADRPVSHFSYFVDTDRLHIELKGPER